MAGTYAKYSSTTSPGGTGITSINGDTTPAQTIAGGSNITVSTSSGTTTISETTLGANRNLSNLLSPTAINQVLLGTDGSSTVPAYSFTSEGGLGWYRSGSHAISLADNGRQALVVTDNGAGGNVLNLPSDPSGLVLGKAPGVFILDIVSNIAGTNFALTQNLNSTQASQIIFQKSRGTNASPTPPLAGDTIGSIAFNGNTTGTSYSTSGRILYSATDNFSGTDRGGQMTFQVVPNGQVGGIIPLTLTNGGLVLMPFNAQVPTVLGSSAVGSWTSFQASTGNLNLNSTSNATKGYVQIADGSAMLLGDTNALTAGIAGSVAGPGSPPASLYLAFDAAGTAYTTFDWNLGIDVFGGGVFNNYGATGGTVASPTFLGNGQIAYSLQVSTWNGTSPDDSTIALIEAKTTQAHSAGNLGTVLNFNATANGSGSPIRALSLFGSDVVTAPNGALTTTATTGFTYVPSCAGAPTGTPNSYTGAVPMVVDTTDSKLYFFIGGTWKSTTLT